MSANYWVYSVYKLTTAFHCIQFFSGDSWPEQRFKTFMS